MTTPPAGEPAASVHPDQRDPQQGHDHDGHQHGLGAPAGDWDWDERYSSSDQIWSGQPNASLVAGVAHLQPGRALDVGCGEGADAVWLVRAGWDVTALDVSGVALERAAKHADEAGATVTWVQAGLVEAQLPARSFDLVSAQYPAVPRAEGDDAELAFIEAVAPGGTLLVVHHAHTDFEDHGSHAFDLADFVFPADVARLLNADWAVEVDETRQREVPLSGGGTHHTHDVVLRARRLR